mmetsp:Transcript_19917/g.59145  ORF Transcript_19917/g.59145 Transcript_19917/m.59145 type:complete len:202 (+) Transcript_19917:413-1018(+)
MILSRVYESHIECRVHQGLNFDTHNLTTLAQSAKRRFGITVDASGLHPWGGAKRAASTRVAGENRLPVSRHDQDLHKNKIHAFHLLGSAALPHGQVLPSKNVVYCRSVLPKCIAFEREVTQKGASKLFATSMAGVGPHAFFQILVTLCMCVGCSGYQLHCRLATGTGSFRALRAGLAAAKFAPIQSAFGRAAEVRNLAPGE